MNKEKIKFEFYTEYMDMLVKDNHPITSINGEDAFYYEKLDNKLSDRIRFHEYLYGLLKIAVENYNRTTMKMMKSYMDNNIDRERGYKRIHTCLYAQRKGYRARNAVALLRRCNDGYG